MPTPTSRTWSPAATRGTSWARSRSGATDDVKGGTGTVDGRTAIALVEKAGAEAYTAWVATDGKHCVLKIVVKGGEEPCTTSFGGFDQPVHAVTPAAKDVTAVG